MAASGFSFSRAAREIATKRSFKSPSLGVDVVMGITRGDGLERFMNITADEGLQPQGYQGLSTVLLRLCTKGFVVMMPSCPCRKGFSLPAQSYARRGLGEQRCDLLEFFASSSRCQITF